MNGRQSIGYYSKDVDEGMIPARDNWIEIETYGERYAERGMPTEMINLDHVLAITPIDEEKADAQADKEKTEMLDTIERVFDPLLQQGKEPTN